MKIGIFLFLISIAFLGCLGDNSIAFDTYSDEESGISFEKPVSWARQGDPLAIVRFGNLNYSSFAVSLVPGKTAVESGQVAQEVYSEFQQNPGFSSIKLESSQVAGFSAFLITFDQATQAPSSQSVAKSYLYIVSDHVRNRVLFLSFITSLESELPINERIMRSFNVSSA